MTYWSSFWQNKAGTLAGQSCHRFRPHRGGAILAFSLVGLLICFPFSIAAWIMGSGDLQQMDGGEMDPGGRSLTSAGRAIGIVGTVLWCGGLLLYLLRLALVESR